MTAATPGSALAPRVREAILWRSGGQIAAQLISWSSTFLVIRLLAPEDYGLFAMTQTVLVLLNLVNGYGIANALIRQKQVSVRELRQALGLLILLNGALAVLQFVCAPLAAAFYGQPEVAGVLRVQSLLYFATPFLALPYAILSRRMEFRRQAQVRMAASLAGAVTALVCGLAGWGVWTLVAAPMALFYVEAIGMTIAARAWLLPLFRFGGAGELLRYGGAMTLAQFFWFLQSQADILIAGRAFDVHLLGIYSTALFLTQLLATKFVPPLNEVAFAAYSRVHGGDGAIGPGFLTAVRLVMLVVLPAYAGLALAAAPLVETVLGPKWGETVQIVPILSLAMPLLTLQILFSPATNALGRPGIAVRTAIAGGIVLPLAFLAGIGWGLPGLAWAWVAGMAVLLLVTIRLSLPVIGISVRDIAVAVAPALFGAAGMAALLAPLAGPAATLPALAQLLLLSATGAAVYAALLLIFARQAVREAIAMVRGAPRQQAATA